MRHNSVATFLTATGRFGAGTRDFLCPRINVGKSDFLKEVRLPHIGILFALLIALGFLLFAAAPRQAHAQYQGPPTGCTPGTCSGNLGFGAGGRFAVGTSTPFSDARFVIVTSSSLWTSSSTPQSEFALKVVNYPCPNGQQYCPPIFAIRNDGSVVIGGGQGGGGSSYYNPPNSSYYQGLTVWGPTFVNGPLSAGDFVSTVNAQKISPNVFNNGTSGNYAFPPGKLGVNTSTNVSIPQELSVYGGGYFSGNVGIGTTAPQNKLVVQGAANTAPFVIDQPDANTTSSVEIRLYGDAHTAANRYAAIREVNNGGANVNELAFLTANQGTPTEKVRIDYLGRVGIGTTAPDSKLHVVTSNASGAPYGSSWTDRFLVVGAAGIGGGIGIGWDSTLPAGIIQSAIPNTGYRNLALNPNGGSVGIGTTQPSSTLHVIGNVQTSGNFIGGLSGTVSAQNVTPNVFNNGTAGNYSFPSSVGIATSTNVSIPQELSVYGDQYVSGNVGIGTTSPTEKLVVGTDLGDVASDVGLVVGGTTYAQTVLGNAGNNRAILTWLASAPYFSIGTIQGGTNYFDTLTVKSGNVGIGTSTPQEILDVNDAIVSRGARGTGINNYSSQTVALMNTDDGT
ncbi:MAG: hypothetical protein HYW65_03370, partial [Candidatus Liptonbacteria bacterium]|nr:hypothetical protein [Candidatus Liptonbacteria bacterium]